MSEELAGTAVEIAEEWAERAHALMAEGLREPMDLDKVSEGSALLRRATALLDSTATP